ncbi:unnamed protein product [Closterium sp. Naga37s-1]|nr:unnamed protein product [Closterium sp. Naga37s-1]
MIFAQVADAVRWCHVHRIAHRDIKPENVLITTIATGGAPDSPDTLEARLADFGLAMEIPTGFSLRGAVGSAPYEAPEVLAGDLYSFGADVWSLGVLLYATISAKWPSFPRNVRKFLPEVDFSVAPWPSVSVEAKDLIRRMLTLDSSQRLDIDSVLAHPWLRIASARSETRKAPRDLKSSHQPSAPIVAPIFPPTEAPKLDFGPETAAPHPHSPKLDSRPESSKARRNGRSSQSAADVDYSEATRIAAPSPRRQFRQSASSQSLCSEGLPLQPTKLPPFHRASPSPLSCPPQGIPLQPSTPKAFPSFPQASPAAASPSPRSCPLQGIPLQPSTPRTPKASPSPRGKTRTGATAALPKGPSAHGSASDGNMRLAAHPALALLASPFRPAQQ